MMKLTQKDRSLIPSSYDIIGDILVFADFPKELNKKESLVGEYFLAKHPNVKVIAKKTKNFSGKYRLPKLKVIAGEKRLETMYKENGIRLKFHLEKVYFSPRLSTERQRINSLVKKGEDVLVMFSGSGVYPINIAKNTKAKSIIGIEANPSGHIYALENCVLNKVTNVGLIKGDVKKIIPTLKKKFDRILMPLPKGAENYLHLAFPLCKKNTVIHYYDFSSEHEFDLVREKLKSIFDHFKKKFEILQMVKCGQYAPRVYRVCVDVLIKSYH